jgi:hypothetical protein
MNKQRHRRRSQGGTSPETTPQTGSGVAHFSVSEVVQFSMSVDTFFRLLDLSVQLQAAKVSNPVRLFDLLPVKPAFGLAFGKHGRYGGGIGKGQQARPGAAEGGRAWWRVCRWPYGGESRNHPPIKTDHTIGINTF